MCTEVEVTAPLVAVDPKADTQAPTTTSEGTATRIWVIEVDFEVVILSLSDFGCTGFLDLVDLVDPWERMPGVS
jgi:hypothetical protein